MGKHKVYKVRYCPWFQASFCGGRHIPVMVKVGTTVYIYLSICKKTGDPNTCAKRKHRTQSFRGTTRTAMHDDLIQGQRRFEHGCLGGMILLKGGCLLMKSLKQVKWKQGDNRADKWRQWTEWTGRQIISKLALPLLLLCTNLGQRELEGGRQLKWSVAGTNAG